MGQETKSSFVFWFACCLFLVAAGPVGAQGLTDGVRFGSFSIHPSMYTSLRYDDNVYFVPDNYRPENERSIPQQIESDLVFNVMPGIIFNLGVPTFTARAGYRFYNDTYLGTDDPDNRHDDLDAANHNFSGLLDYQAPFGLMIGASDSYAIMETYEETEQFIDYLRGDQIHNEARGWLGFRHGPYDNLFIRAMYRNVLDQYDNFDQYDKLGQFVEGELRLKFFPRTAVVAEGGYGMTEYDRAEEFNSTSWWAMGGLQGQITNHLMTVLKGGWAMADYDTYDDLGTWLANAELTVFFPLQTQLTGGYRRFFRDAADTNYYTSHEGYLHLNRLWWARLNAHVMTSYQYNIFSEPLERQEDFIQAGFDLNYRFVHWLFIGGGYKMEYRIYDDAEVRETTIRNVGTIHMQAQF